ncbi:DUF5643 domain-containing protein [Clostridium fungisolvens]|uniref:DUF5643 domain-containing protein n=1 Tax=Clostridium fungisolvens TaxID=1604897 RepID=A0A6V8SNX5_9CLOT|nr:DUF5643 domain-containing protein [Clostridium fungisolvens]GFP76563.1 hypothetical protein bsdtw1_02666 [Clostridium fungisolvens]
MKNPITIICLIIIIIGIFTNLPESKYYDKELKELVNQKKAQVIEVNKDMKIDNDTVSIKRIINTDDKTYIRSIYRTSEPGWSFSTTNVINIFDDKGKKYQYRGGENKGKIWGQDELMEVERIDEDAKYLILKLDWYDRKAEMTISLDKEKNINENK